MLDWTGTPEEYFHNEHESMVENRRNKHVCSIDGELIWLERPESEMVMSDYVTDTYPAYFGLELRDDSNMACLRWNSMKFVRYH